MSIEVTYRHEFTVVVEGHDSFTDDAQMSSLKKYADDDARSLTLLVKRGGTDPKPVRTSRVTRSIVIVEHDS